MLFFDTSFVSLVTRLRSRLSHVQYVIALSPETGLVDEGYLSYESLIAQENDALDWPLFDENSAAFLCYTSGTTGNPKGVLYSHRSIILHALAASLSGALGLGAFDNILPCASFYHATGWGIPFIALINGCGLVLPCDKFDSASLQELIRCESVTFSGGVPTIWTMYLAYLEATGEGTGTLRRIVMGGSAVPRAMSERFHQKYGIQVLQIWGMTETSPLGVVSTPTPKLTSRGTQATNDVIWTRQGRLQFGIELQITDPQGNCLHHDGVGSGSLRARGPWTIERYFKSPVPTVDQEGWFVTGDLATIDSDGYLRITDREKDVIKSGGEWISSIDLENVAAACPGVKVAAVVGIHHPKWEERPILIIELQEGATTTRQDILDFVEARIAKWWTPDAVIFDRVPLTATGKIDKKSLRERFRNYLVQS